MSGDNFTQFRGIAKDDEESHQIVSKDNPLPVTLQSEVVATDQSDGTEEAVRDLALKDSIDELVVQMKILNAYMLEGFDIDITKDDVT